MLLAFRKMMSKLSVDRRKLYDINDISGNKLYYQNNVSNLMLCKLLKLDKYFTITQKYLEEIDTTFMVKKTASSLNLYQIILHMIDKNNTMKFIEKHNINFINYYTSVIVFIVVNYFMDFLWRNSRLYEEITLLFFG